MKAENGYTTVQIRELPIGVWNNIKLAAAFTDQSASDYVVGLLTKASNRLDEFKSGGFETGSSPKRTRRSRTKHAAA